MELPSKLSERIAFNTRANIEEHMLIVMEKYTHEEYLYQPLQTNNKQFKIAVTFLSAYNGIFNVTKPNNKFSFKKSLVEEEINQIRIPEGAYEIESLNDEIKRIIIDNDYYKVANYPFKIKPNFSTLGNIIQIHQPAMMGFVYDNSIGN